VALKFTKMHGLGNDFVVIDAINQTVDLTEAQVKKMADRRFGVGCDQLLIVEATNTPNVDFRYRIFNADGSEVEQCGNGARCFARYVTDYGLTQKSDITVETASGVIVLHMADDGWVRVNMGAPRLIPNEIPFVADAQSPNYAIEVAGETYDIGAVSMGNPHAVFVVDDIQTDLPERIGALVESHERFPNRVNVGFMQVMSKEHIKLRVYERGAGETMACGTGACGAAVVGQVQGLLGSSVRVELPGGPLQIEWSGDYLDPVWMTGPTAVVFDGEWLDD